MKIISLTNGIVVVHTALCLELDCTAVAHLLQKIKCLILKKNVFLAFLLNKR